MNRHTLSKPVTVNYPEVPYILVYAKAWSGLYLIPWLQLKKKKDLKMFLSTAKLKPLCIHVHLLAKYSSSANDGTGVWILQSCLSLLVIKRK